MSEWFAQTYIFYSSSTSKIKQQNEVSSSDVYTMQIMDTQFDFLCAMEKLVKW